MEFGKVRIPWKDWKVVSQIGEGGYGKVYQIERTQSDITDCEALKVIRIPKDENEYKEIVKDKGSAEKAKAYILKQKDNVLNEVKKLKEIQGSENIVIIKEWAIEELEDGYSWEVLIRMELLTPLDKKIEEEGLPDEAEVIRIGLDICSALSRCEKKKIIHRDIKQGNILVSNDGVYKLSDFGISRNLESVTTVTGVGAKPYMAPEVAKYLKTGKTIDTYSLGIVLYELLNNNRIPFLEAEGDFTTLDKGRAIQRRIDGEKLPEPANGSEELKRVILKACEYNPKDRYKNAEEMKQALLKIVRGEEETVNEKEIYSEEGDTQPKGEGMTIAAPADQEAEIEALKSRLASLVEANEHSGFALTPFPERTLELDNEKGKQTDAQSLEELEKELFGTTAGEAETTKKIDKFYTLYKKNEEFQRLLDEEYSRLKGEHIDLPDEDFKNEPEVIAEDNFIFKPEVTAEDDVIFAGLSAAHEKAVREELVSGETPTAESEILAPEDSEKERLDTTIGENDEYETNKKIDKFYTMYKKNEEYQRFLDEEYSRLKGEHIDFPDEETNIDQMDMSEDQEEIAKNAENTETLHCIGYYDPVSEEYFFDGNLVTDVFLDFKNDEIEEIAFHVGKNYYEKKSEQKATEIIEKLKERIIEQYELIPSIEGTYCYPQSGKIALIDFGPVSLNIILETDTMNVFRAETRDELIQLFLDIGFTEDSLDIATGKIHYRIHKKSIKINEINVEQAGLDNKKANEDRESEKDKQGKSNSESKTISYNGANRKKPTSLKKKKSKVSLICALIILLTAGIIIAYFNGLILQPAWAEDYYKFVSSFDEKPDDYINGFSEYFYDPLCKYHLNDVNGDGKPELFIEISSISRTDMDRDSTMVFSSTDNDEFVVTMIGDVELIDEKRGLIVTNADENKYHIFTFDELADNGQWDMLGENNPATIRFTDFSEQDLSIIDDSEYSNLEGVHSRDFDSHFLWSKKPIRRYIGSHRGDERKRNRKNDLSQIYLHILRANRAKIKDYNWQADWKKDAATGAIGNKQNKHVIVDDVNDDGVPELLFMSVEDTRGAQLTIYQYDGDNVIEVDYSVNNAPGILEGKYTDLQIQGGTNYMMYKGTDNCLYILDSFGGVHSMIYSSIKIDLDLDISEEPVVEVVTKDDTGYYKEGAKVEDTEGQRQFQDAASKYGKLLMYSGITGEDTTEEFKMAQNAFDTLPISMTYEDADNYLSSTNFKMSVSGGYSNIKEQDTVNPALKSFFGGWGCMDTDDGDICKIRFITVESGELKVEFAAIPGGGYDASFKMNNVEVSDGILNCTNGKVQLDGGKGVDAVLMVRPDDSQKYAYHFELSYTDENGEQRTDDSDEKLVFYNVGETRVELQKWIEYARETKRIRINNVSDSSYREIEKPEDVSIRSEEDAVEYAQRIAKDADIDLNYADNIFVRCEKYEEGVYHIRAYEDHPEHIVTIFDCKILTDGRVKDFLLR